MPKHNPDPPLTEAEQELSRLAGELETLVKDDDYFRAVLALGHRARTLFFGVIHATYAGERSVKRNFAPFEPSASTPDPTPLEAPLPQCLPWPTCTN
jgi:hypothetical protein